MLTKDLLDVKKRKPNITPRFREPGEYEELARMVIEAYVEGRKRHEIWDRIEELETHDNFKFVRGLAKLVERDSEFEVSSSVEPREVREKLYSRGFVTSRVRRGEVVEEVASELGIDEESVDETFWADREENEVLVSEPEYTAENLVKEYNLSLSQTLLFDAVELDFKVSGNYQEIFRRIKYLGLMYQVNEDLEVNVTGPAALFRKTRKYGTTLAKLLPAIINTEKWWLNAKVETEVRDEKKIYEFVLDSEKSYLFPEKENRGDEEYDSEVEKSFGSRIESLIDWKVEREPTILRAGNRVMIPDFSFHKGDEEFYVEVVGFWTPEYLEEKIKKVRAVESEKPMILAVNESLRCSEDDFEGVDEVFFYDRKIPVKPVVERINDIDEEIVESDKEKLRDEELDFDLLESAEVQKLEEIADKKDVENEAVRDYLEENAPGVTTEKKYISSKTADEIREEIDSLDSKKLSDVNVVLDEYGLGEDVLEKLGYSVEWTSFDQDEIEVRKK